MLWNWMLNMAIFWLSPGISFLAEWTLLASAFHLEAEIDYRLFFCPWVFLFCFVFIFQLLSWGKIECITGNTNKKPLIIQAYGLKRLSLIYEGAYWVFPGVYLFDHVSPYLNASVNQYRASPHWVCRIF